MEDEEALRRALRRADDNLLVMELFSALLNEKPAFYTKEEVEGFARDCGLRPEEAFRALLAALCGLEGDTDHRHRYLTEKYFDPAIQRLDADVYRKDPYYETVRLPEKRLNNWRMATLTYQPYEVFCYGDPAVMPDGREIPPIGYFAEPFSYPAVLEDERLWMAVTPNEVETMRRDIAAAHGKIAVFGLGLGYYAFMTARKENITSVTVIERDESVISLFREYLLPQFPHKEKIQVIQADAYDYLQKEMGKERYDFAYIDLWHDVLDGTPLYLRARLMEGAAPGTEFTYWIEDSMLLWLRGLILEEVRAGEGKMLSLLKARYPGQALLPLLTIENLRAFAPLIPPESIQPE